MYGKKKLENLELPSLPLRREDAVYRVPGIQYIMRCRVNQEHKLLIVAFFDRAALANGFDIPKAVLYQGKDGFVTRIVEQGHVMWKKSRILSALNIKSDKGICLRISDEKTIRRFLPHKKVYSYLPDQYDGYGIANPNKDNILNRIYRYQTWLQEQNNGSKKMERRRKTDEVMKTVPAVPSAFWHWVDNMPMKHSRYMPYHRLNRKTAECTCTHCQTVSLLPAKEVKREEKGICPSCGSTVTFKADGLSYNKWDEGYSTLLQQLKNGDFILRFFQHSRTFRSGWPEAKDTNTERARLFFTKDGKITGSYKHGSSPALGRHGWYPCKEIIVGKDTKWDVAASFSARAHNDWFEPSYLYPHNMRAMLGQLDLPYSMQKDWCGQTMDVTTTLLQTLQYPFAPRLAAAGLKRLDKDIYYYSEQLASCKRSGSLHNCLCVSQELMPYLVEHDVSVEILNVLTGLPNPVEADIVYLKSARELAVIKDLIHFTTLHKIRKYIAVQKEVQQKKRHYGDIPINWRDYIQLAVELGYDVKKKSVLFPKDVMQEHDKLVQLKQIKYDPVVDAKIKKAFPALQQRYSYEDNNYLITVPRNFEDFKAEGVTLLHCLCTNKYYLNHLAGTNLIFFLRLQGASEAPYFTIRYDPRTNVILECHGYRHSNPDDAVKAFTGKWRRFIANTNPSAEEAA